MRIQLQTISAVTMKLKHIFRVSILMLFFSLFLRNGAEVYGQDNMGIGNLNPDPSALLHVDNLLQNKGLLVPRMTTVQRDAIPTPANGLLIYNTECNVFNYYKLDHWVSINGITISGGNIFGQPNPCQSSIAGYSIPSVSGSSNYTWTVPPGASIVNGQGTDSITVQFGTANGNVCVKAVNTCGDADSLCLPISLATAAFPPTALAPSDFTCTSVVANWSPVISATQYFLYVSTNNTFSSGMLPGFNPLVVPSNQTSATVTPLAQNTTYYYRLKVVNGCDTSVYSNVVNFSTTPPSAPTATAASNVTCTGFQANWGPILGATSYILSVSTNSQFSLPLFGTYPVIGGNTFAQVGPIQPNTTYYYRVQAVNLCDTSSNSNTINISTSAPVAPTATAASDFQCNPFSFRANWGAVTGAVNYFVDVSTAPGFTSYVGGYQNFTSGGNTYITINNGVQGNATYYYRVRALGCDTSSYSNSIIASTYAPTSPTATSPSNATCTSFNANWGSVDGAITYHIDLATSADFSTPVFTDSIVGNITTFNITGLTPNTTYYYRVRADNGCGISGNSNTITFGTTAPIAPTATPADNFTCTSVNANWGSVTGAIYYFVDVSTTASFSSFLIQDSLVGNVTTFNITGLVPNTTYYYRVRAHNGCSVSGNSNTISLGTTAPIAPTATLADNYTCTSVNANWGAVNGAILYYLDVSTSSSFANYLIQDSLVGNVTTFNITGLTPNTSYYYRVRADNGCSISNNSNTVTFGTTAPIAPTATPADNYTCTTVNANWGSVPSAIGYFLDVSTSSSFANYVTGFQNLSVGNATTYNITGLTPNVTYYFRVRSDNGCSISSNSNTVVFGTTAPIAPTATPADNFTCTSMSANWGSVPGATQYFLDVSTNANFTTFVSGFQNLLVGNVTTFNVTGLTPNVYYYYRVRAGNGCSVSLSSNTISIGTTAPISPTATPASNFTCTSMNANWGAVPGATNYILDVATSASFAPGTVLASYNNLSVGNVTTYLVTGLTPNVTYHYRVRADNGCSISANSNTISIGTTAPIAPTATTASNFTCTSFNANWGAVPGAFTYYVDVATAASFAPGTILTSYTNFNTGNVTTYNFTGLTANVVHYYRVRADNGCSVSSNSNTIVVGTSTPISPTATPADNFTCTSFNANWGAVPGAIQYFIDVATNASFAPATILTAYNNVNAGPATTLNITGLTANVVYYYRVRADNGCSLSLYSNTISAGTTPPISPTATSATNLTCTSFNANWGAVSGAINYLLDVSTNPSFTTFVTGYNAQPTANVTTLNVTGLSAGVTYYYRVRADNGCSISTNSNTVTVGTTAPIPPTATPADNFTCTSFNANWGAVTGATAYFLDVSTDVNFSTTFVLNNQTVGNATTYNVTGLIANTTYYFRVRASNGCLTSGNSNTVTVATSAPVPPTATSADNFTCTSFNANWGAVTGATIYFLDVSTNVNFSTTVISNQNVGNATTYNVTSLVANTTYYYRVRASNGCSVSGNSNTITVGTTSPVAPTATDANNFTCTSFNANWGAVTGATQYFLDVATNATFTGTLILNNQLTGSATTFNVTGLTANTTYYYRVRATNGCATSLNSNTITVGTTAPVAPSANPASNFTCTSFNANWGAVTGATQYFLDVSTDASFATFQTGYNNQNVGNVTTLNITGLTANITYFYRVRASNGCLTSLNSNTITVGTTAPVAPTATDANNFTCTSFNANWGAVTGATQYFLDVSTNANFSTFQSGYNNQNVGNVTTLNITGLTANVTYFYRVRASNGCATSLSSNTITIGTTAPVAPSANPASNFTCTSFNANWGAVTGATQYFLDVSTDASFATFQTGYNNQNVGNVTTLNITGLIANVTYFYRVRASNGCATSLNSNTITVGTTAPVAPTATDANNFTCTSFNANWGAVTGATQYFLDVSTNANFSTFQTGYNNQNVGNVTTLNITGLTANVTYFYRVRASNGCATSLSSNTITIGTTAPVAPSANPASNFTCTSFNANWGAVTGATQYFLDVSTDASFATFQTGYNNQNVGNVTTLNITGLTANITYFYRVRASNGCATSLNSNTITVGTTAPVAPSANPASNFTCTSFNANWGAVTGATQYFLDVSTDASFATFQTGYNNQNVGNVTTLNITGLTANVTYFYRVRASNGCATSLNSNTITVATTSPVAPTATDANNFTCNSFNANWGAVTGATQYFLDVSTNANFSTFQTGYNNQNVGNVTTLNITGLTANITYYYRVRASNGCATSLSSNTITVGTTSPVAPTATDANNFTCSSFNANWGAVTGATQYFLDVSTSASFANFLTGYNNQNVGSATTYNVTGLSANGTYFYRVRATNGCATSNNSNTITVTTTAPIAPTATDANNFTCTSFNANWGAVGGATQYFLDVSTSASFTTFQTGYNNLNVGNVTTYNISGLTANITYFYRVRASNGCSVSLNSNTITVGTTAPVAPTATDANNFTCNSFNANWGAVTGATQYIIDVSTSASFANFLTGYNSQNVGNVTTLNVTGLSPNGTYFYRVRATNGCATSNNSNTIVVTTTAPIAPTATDATNFTCTSFNANWGAVLGATQYFIDVSTDASFANFQTGFNNLNVGSVTTYNISGLTANVTYFYRIRASNGCSTSLNSNTVTVGTTAPVAPTATDANNFTCTSFNANWGAVTGATQYIVDVSTDASFTTTLPGYGNLNVGNVTTLNIIGLTANQTYFYRVRATNGCANSNYSNTITVATTAPIAPTATDANNFTCTSFNANWGAVVGATQYFLDVSTSATFANFITGFSNKNVGNVTTYNVGGLSANGTYFYRIRASNGCSTSLNSGTITVTTTAPVAPTATDPSNFTCNSFNANWGAVFGATQYYIDVATSPTFGSSNLTGYSNKNVGNVTTYNITGLTNGVVYYYRIRSSNGCSTSLNSNTITVSTTAPVSPTATPATNFTCTSFNANWGAVTGATQYIIEVSTDAGFGTYVTGYNNLNVGNVTTLNITGLTSNTTYFYRVSATNGCATSLASNTISVGTTAPIAPIAASASNFTCTSFNANWGTVIGATQYFLDVSTSPNFTTFQGTYNNKNVGNVTTFLVTGLIVNTTYYYRVRADNGCTFSANSNTIDVTTTSPIAPVALNADNFTCNTFNANWAASAGATSYRLDVSTIGTFANFVPGFNNFNVGAATTYNVTGLTNGGTYYYRVRAVNGCATSGNSNIIVVTISAPVAPNGIDASNITCTSLNANWGVSSGATGYYLDVSTSATFANFLPGYNNTFVGNTNTYNIIGLQQNVTYYYRVRAINGCATSVNSNTVTASTTAPSAPITLNGSNFTCTSFNANWSPVLGAVAYYLDVSTNPGFTTFVTGYNDLNVGTANTYPITGLAQNANYYYRVRAANICSTSTNSNSTEVTTSAPIAPTSSGSSNLTCTSFNANWGATVGATNYILDVSTNPNYTTFVSGYNGLNVGNVTTYNITGLTVNTTYYYRVRAGNGCSISLNSNSIMTVTAAPFAPIAVSASNLSCSGFSANWGGSVGAIGYFIDVSTSATYANLLSGYNNLNVGNVTTYPISGLVQGQTYYYRVRAASGCTTSPNSNTINITISAPDAPAALPATNVACTSFNINWSNAVGATTYLIDVSTTAQFTTYATGYQSLNTNGVVTTYNISNPPAVQIVQGGTYFYRVRSINGCDTSGYSNIGVVTTAQVNAPVALAASDIACTVFNANWAGVQGATGYRLDVSTSASFANYVAGFQDLNVGNVLTYNVTGLTLNRTYYYRIRATTACAVSTNSNTIVAATNAPPAPNATSATNVTCTSMNANWSSVSGVIGYYLDVSTDPNFGSFLPGYQNQSVGNVTTYNVTGLPGSTVYFRVRSATACTQSINSNMVTVNPSAIAAPNAGAATNVACAVFDANWAAVTGALSYEIDVSTSASFATIIGAYNDLDVGNVTTYNVSGLSVNNLYYYRVRSKNACVTSPNSVTISVSTNAPNAPVVGDPTNITCSGFNVNWQSVNGAITYYLDVSTSASFATYITPYQDFDMGNSTTYNVSGLSSFTPPFYFRIKAVSGCATGNPSAVRAVNPAALNAPASAAATSVLCTGFTANWTAVSGALSYSIDVSTNSAFTAILPGYNDLTIPAPATSYSVTGLATNRTHYYRIRANNACVASANSAIISVTTSVPVATTTLTADNLTCGGFRARWNAVSGVLNYYIDVTTDQTFASNFINNALISGSPSLVTNYQVNNLSQSTIYYYRVRAENGCGIGTNSDVRVVSTTAPTAPTLQDVTTSTCSSFLVQWSVVSGATSYDVQVSTDPTFAGSFIFNANVGNPSTNPESKNITTGIVPGIIYYYRVRSQNLCGESSWTSAKTFKIEDPTLPAPSLNGVNCTGAGVQWPIVLAATSYVIDVSEDPSFGGDFVVNGSITYNNYNVGNTTSISIGGLTSPPGSGQYYFRMKAINTCGQSGWSDVLTIITRAPSPPNMVGINPEIISCTAFKAIWNSTIGANTYLLDVSTSSTFANTISPYSGLNVGNTTTFTVPNLSAGTYYYRVKGSNGCGTPVASSAVTVVLGAPVAVTATAGTNIGANSFTANWNSGGTNVTAYYIDVWKENTFSSGNEHSSAYVNKNVGAVTSTSVTGLSTGWVDGAKKAFYRVRAANGCGTSANSNVITVNAP